MDIASLRQARAKALTRAREINDKAVEANRELNASERRDYDSAMQEFHTLGDRIKREEQLTGYEATMNEIVTVQVDQNISSRGFTGGGSFRDENGNELRAFRHNEPLVNDTRGDASDFGNLIVERVTGRRLVSPEQRAAQIDSDVQGGFLLSAGASNRIWDHARGASVVSRLGATTIPLTTRKRTLATVESDPSFTWAPELSTITPSDFTFGALELRARKVACRIEISDEMLKFANAGALITRVATDALAAEIDRVSLVGTGDGEEPTGALYTSGILTEAIGGAISIDKLIDSATALAEANVEATSYITTPAIAGYIDKLKDGEGRYFTQLPGAAGRMTPHTTSKMASDALIMGKWSDMILAPVPQIAVDLVKDVQTGRGSYLLQILAYFDCGLIWPGHFRSMTAISTS